MPDAELVAQQRHDDMDGIPPPAAQLDVVGHEAAFGALTQALDGGRMHHAWLLQGPQGIGKARLPLPSHARFWPPPAKTPSRWRDRWRKAAIPA